MDLIISKSSATPLYRQIYEQIVKQISNHHLLADSCLPSIRFVAKELNISVISVKNAYDELEKYGYIYTIAGKGCFVANQDSQEIKYRLIQDKAQEVIDFCNMYNIEATQIFDEITKRQNQ